MKVIISPAKKMNMETDLFPVKGLPAFMEKNGAPEGADPGTVPAGGKGAVEMQ